ncbi:MAG: GNAT family N-acetyltransferase [bacterium]|nr:GNAT family N-acetyltransferase [bacterium]
MQVRSALPEDIPAIVDLWVEFMDFHTTLDPDFVRGQDSVAHWTEYVTGLLDAADHCVLVADDEDVLAGYIVAIAKEIPPYRTIRKYGYLQEIGVARRFRRQGVGRRLVAAAEEWMRAQGVPHAEVRIYVNNDASQRLFRSAGFAPHTEVLHKKYDNGA